MRKELLGKMDEEYRMLYEISQKKSINSTLTEMVTREIIRIKRSMKASGRDGLAAKLHNYGNGGGWGASKMRELAKAVYQDKKPEHIDLGKWVSIEIECIFQSKAKETEFVSFVRSSGLSKMTTLKTDGSVYVRQCECDSYVDEETDERVHEDHCMADAQGAFGREIVLTFKFGDFGPVKAICDKLNAIGCTVNKTCGLHVHFDMRHIEDTRQLSTIGQRVAKAVPALKMLMPKSRADNRFCARAINTLRSSGQGSSRYTFVNVASYKRHKTIEFRGHSGTTDATKIINWVRILRIIMDKPNRQPIENTAAMLAKYDFSDDLAKYIQARSDKFANQKNTVFVQADDVAYDNLVAETGQEELVLQIDTAPVGANQLEASVA